MRAHFGWCNASGFCRVRWDFVETISMLVRFAKRFALTSLVCMRLCADGRTAMGRA